MLERLFTGLGAGSTGVDSPSKPPPRTESAAALSALLARGRHMSGAGVPPDFECLWRAAAYAEGERLQPFLAIRLQRAVWDALELTSLCGELFRPYKTATPAKLDPACEMQRAARIVNVSSVAQLRAALDLAASSSDPTRIQLAPGTYALNSPLKLSAAHSNTSIIATPGAPPHSVVLSGAATHRVKWTKAKTVRGISVWRAQLPKGLRVDSLRVDGARATRARFPNADPQRDQFPKGWVTESTKSLPPTMDTNTSNYEIALKGAYPGMGPGDRYGPHGFNGAYRVGVGGNCRILTPPMSYWCQPNGRVDGEPGVYFFRQPSGIRNASAALAHAPYANADNLTIFYWRPGHWFTVMMEGEMDTRSGDLHFVRGGFQGAEGHDTVAEWYVEGVEEELDAPNEFHYDGAAGSLLLYYNGTGMPPRQVEVATLTELIVAEGSPADAVRGVAICGVVLTGQRPTYLEPHGTPSGGDWGLEQLGAIRLKGVTNVTIAGNRFTTLDGNALFLDGYARDVRLVRNEFVSLGASAIALWGEDGFPLGDGTSGRQPRGTLVSENICYELGIYQKQSSCYFHAVSAQSTVTRNIFFNGPRALVNFNDNFGGAHELGHNLMFNSCRESSDHGVFNSWGRQPYLTTLGDGHTVSARPAYSRLHHNFIVANYAADGGCFDNDDGSSFYLEEKNFCVYGGMKSNFEGSNKRATGNLHAFASVYGDHCLSGINQISDEWADGYANNTCILAKRGDSYISLSQPESAKGPLHLLLGNNTVYAPGAEVLVHAVGRSYNGAAWLALGLDVGTVLRDSAELTSAQIVVMGVAILHSD